MATIKQQGKGYKITVSLGSDVSGKKIREHMTWVPADGMTQKQIEKELQRQSVLFEERVRHSGTRNSNIRLVDFTELYLREYAWPFLKAKTAFGYAEKMKLANEALGHIKLKDLRPGHIAAFYANLQEEGVRRDGDPAPLKPGTIHAYHRALSAVLSKAVKWAYIRENPSSGADLPSIAGRKAAYLEEGDARRLLELLHGEPIKWRALITFDLLSGLRRGELAGLRWTDVDIDAQTITITQTSNYLPGRGVYTDTPKTANSHRPLRLSRSAFLLLLEYRQWQDAQRASLGDAWEDKDERVFTTDFGAPMFPDSISQWFAKFIRRTGLPKVTVHSLRHTYASLMIADGVPLVVVSHQLGHAQASTTANIYAHAIKSAEVKAAQTFDKFDDVIAQKQAVGE